MGNLIINIIGILILVGIGYYFYFKTHPHAFDHMLEKQMRKNAELLKKNDADMYGKRYEIHRDNGTVIRTNLYVPAVKGDSRLPALVIAHGGNFMDGSADQIDTLCNRLKENLEAVVISVDYTLLTEKQFPYQHEEIRDTVLWVAKHASDFNIDAKKIVLAGFSAGAYLMIGAASILRDLRFTPAGLILCYPLIDDTMVRLADAGVHPSPVSILSCGKDPMNDRADLYCEHLTNAGVEYELRTYAEAYSGFMEANNPEYMNNPKFSKSPVINEDQANMARAAEIWFGGQFEGYTSKLN